MRYAILFTLMLSATFYTIGYMNGKLDLQPRVALAEADFGSAIQLAFNKR